MKHLCLYRESIVLSAFIAAVLIGPAGCSRNEPQALPEPEAEQQSLQPPVSDSNEAARSEAAAAPRPAWVPEATPPQVSVMPPEVASSVPPADGTELRAMPETGLPPGPEPLLQPGGSDPESFSENPLRRNDGIQGESSETASIPAGAAVTHVPENPAAENPAVGNPAAGNPAVHTDGKPRGKKGDGNFDPIAVNGPIFVDWPKPKLALVITGCQIGYMEPCGCAGLDRMKGGMSRRHSLFRELREKRGWPTVGLDVGGIARGYGKQAELKFHIMVDGMRTMGYDAVALGAAELRLPTAELVAVAASTPDQPSMFLSSNVGLFGFDAGLTATHRIIEQAGVTLGVTGVLGAEFQKELNNSEIELMDAETAIQKVLPNLKSADIQILLAHATVAESEALARRFPEFDLVVTAGGAPEPPAQPKQIEGANALLIEVGEKGMDAIVLGLYNGPATEWRYQRVPLDSRFPQSPDMRALMTAYQHQVKSLGFAGLGIRPAPHPLKEVGGDFVGSQKCESCHEPSYRIWRKSSHAKAYQTLAELDPPRQFDPECISCHVIGWHPTQYFPYEGGFSSLEETPHLKDVGCESCHGPGGNHVRAEMKGTPQEQEQYRKALVVTKQEAHDGHCASCHDLDNSPDFDFDTYWPDVEHYEDQ